MRVYPARHQHLFNIARQRLWQRTPMLMGARSIGKVCWFLKICRFIGKTGYALTKDPTSRSCCGKSSAESAQKGIALYVIEAFLLSNKLPLRLVCSCLFATSVIACEQQPPSQPE